jgi:hypothetical protein
MIISTEIKLVIAAGATALLLLAGYGLYNHGKTVAGLECEKAQKIAIEDAVKKAKEDWDSQLQISQSGKENVTKTVEKIVTVEKRIPVIVTKCDDVGGDYAGVYNDIVEAIRTGGAEAGPVASGKVPSSGPDGTTNSR